MVGVNFFFDLFSQSGLRAFFTSDFANCTTDYAPTIRCWSEHLMVGVIFFWPVLPFWTEAIFHKWFCQLYYKLCPSPKITPTIRCCEQHLMVGFNFFFLTSAPILDLGHFSQMILPIVYALQIMPKIIPTIRCCSQHLMVVGFLLTYSPILDLGHFSQVILPIVLQTICPTIRCCSQHLMVGVIFFWPVLPFWT